MRRVTVFKPIETSITPAQMPEQQAREHEASLFAFLNIIVPVPSHQLGMFTKYMSMYSPLQMITRLIAPPFVKMAPNNLDL